MDMQYYGSRSSYRHCPFYSNSAFVAQVAHAGLSVGGAVLGPAMGLGLIHNAEAIQGISEIGLVLLLYIIGLKLTLKS